MTTLLEIRGLNTYYGESHILRDVDLNVKAGEMVCLIGRNGVGKTTLLKSLIGLLRPRRGEIVFSGNRLDRQAPHQRARAGVGYVPQGRGRSFRSSRWRRTFNWGWRRCPVGWHGIDSLTRLSMSCFRCCRSFCPVREEISAVGQQQQLAIARALLGKPKLLLLDEPTEGIQPNIVQDIENAVRRIIAETGIGVLLVEQHLHFVRQADRYYAMQRGGIVASGPTSDLSQAVVDQFLSV